VVERLTNHYVAGRQGNETFQAFVKRIGKVEIKKLLDDLTKVPAYEVDSSYFSDWGDSRVFTIGDIGIGECAGEVVSRIEFELAAAERQIFEGQVHLEAGQDQRAGESAYAAMLQAARGLVKEEFYDVPNDPERIVNEFRTRFYDTRIFWDPYAHGKFGQYLFGAHANAGETFTAELAHQRLEEAQLVVEAANSAYQRWRAARQAPQPVGRN
jgi:sulfite reductase (ferredoxin)